MNIDTFRAAPERTAEAAGSGLLSDAIAILENEAPHRKPIVISTETTAQVQLGRIMGFQEAIDLISLMKRPAPPKVEHIEPSYTNTTTEDQDHA